MLSNPPYSQLLDDISNNVVGYIYTFAWGFSFLGQIQLNHKLRSVEGCNLDFVIYNVTGFSFYTIYNFGGYFYPDYTGIKNVEVNDIVFAGWALIMTIITLVQCFFIYDRGQNKVSRTCMIATPIYWLIAFLWLLLTNLTNAVTPTSKYYNTFFMLSYIKLFISLTKYVPQAYWNYQRQSTQGWSIVNILLDFTGGSFSMLQIVLNSINGTDSTFSSSANASAGLNVGKFGLSIISMAFDVLFMIQHYILYNPNRVFEKKMDRKLLSQNDDQPMQTKVPRKKNNINENSLEDN